MPTASDDANARRAEVASRVVAADLVLASTTAIDGLQRSSSGRCPAFFGAHTESVLEGGI